VKTPWRIWRASVHRHAHASNGMKAMDLYGKSPVRLGGLLAMRNGGGEIFEGLRTERTHDGKHHRFRQAWFDR
jgi:hypothetical protein